MFLAKTQLLNRKQEDFCLDLAQQLILMYLSGQSCLVFLLTLQSLSWQMMYCSHIDLLLLYMLGEVWAIIWWLLPIIEEVRSVPEDCRYLTSHKSVFN